MGKLKSRVGEKHLSKQGYEMLILEYFGESNCTIQFNDERCTTLKGVQYGQIRRGVPANPFHRTVKGVGYLGIGPHVTSVNGVKTHKGELWHGIMKRCYCHKFHEKNPTYIGCVVDDRWHDFQAFGDWYDERYVEGFELDKDILVYGNKIYGPETCCFVPSEINKSFKTKSPNNKLGVLGVSKYHGKFMAHCNVEGKSWWSKCLSTIEEAALLYKSVKEQEVKRLADKYKDNLSNECYNKLVNYKV